MMSDVIRQETTVFFLAIALGAGLSFFYDFLRARSGSHWDRGSSVLAVWRLPFVCADVLRHRRGAARLCAAWYPVRGAALSADCGSSADPGRNSDGKLYPEKTKKMFFYIEIQ